MMFNGDVGWMVRVYLVSLGIQWLGWPIARKFFGQMKDGGWAMGRLVTTVGIGLVMWFAGHVGINISSNFLLIGLVGIVALIALKLGAGVEKKYWGVIVIEESLWLVGFVGESLIRGFNPQILDLEKFMDFGFVKQYLVTETLPAKDMWFAGESINYYSFGHFWASIIIRLWGVPAVIGFNLMFGWILGQSLMLVMGIIYHLAINKRAGVVGGIVGAMLTTLGGNSHILWQWISKRTLSGYWYADATRFIYHTIHEFPGYSFVVADLHAHLLGLPMSLALIWIIIAWWRDKDDRLGIEVTIGILLGVLAMTNTWDVGIYGLLLVVIACLELATKKSKWFELVRFAGVALIVMIAIAVPWVVHFRAITGGIRWVTTRSPVWQLVVLWGGQLILCAMAGAVAMRKPKNTLVLGMIITAMILLILPEVIYIKDIYPEHPRANTMFKFTYQAFVMMSLVSGWIIGRGFVAIKPIRAVWIALGLAWLYVLMTYPYNAFGNYYGHLNRYKGLTGDEWFKRGNPERYAMAKYLEENRDGKNMVEAVGDSYTEADSLAVFSGVPTILGWRVHEWLWRGGYTEVGRRDAEVRRIYEGGNEKEIRQLLDKYNVGWIAVGKEEREKYSLIKERELGDMGEVVWMMGNSYLIRVAEN